VYRSLPGFDEWLNGVLAVRAREAGEDLDLYIARAVASRLIEDQVRIDADAMEDLLAHLSSAGVVLGTLLPNVSTVIGDPERLRVLHATGLLDSPPEDDYDRITRMAADALDAPQSAISLVDVDRQFFKSSVGREGLGAQERQTPLANSICQYTVANAEPLVLTDARLDPILKHHPAVRDGSVVAYLGIPLIDGNGYAVGTLCVSDTKPRVWTTGHVQILRDLAQLAAERVFAAPAAH